MIQSLKFRLYPNREQVEKLNRALNTCRDLYNASLEQRRTAWRNGRHSVRVSGQMAELPELKRELPEVGEVYSQVLQDVLWRSDTSFQNFFRRVRQHKDQVGFPRFKSKNRYDSLCYPQLGCSIAEGRLHLSKIGNIKIKLHRPIEGRIKTCRIKRDVDEWYALFACESPDVLPVESQSALGIDVGLESCLTTSAGEPVENPRWLTHALKKLRTLQRSLSRKRRGSGRRSKACVRVAQPYREVRRQRLDFHHKVARDLVDRYDTIVIEDLNVAGMVRNHCLARHISDVGWAGFANILTSKAEWAGGQVIRVNPRNTSQVCSGCGCIMVKKLSERWHHCPHCGLSLNRDHNAALNILHLGQGHCLQAQTGSADAVA